MFNYSPRRSTKKKAFELHEILRDYRRFQQEKHMLQNRINIMQSNQMKNNNKSRNIEDHYHKIKFAQEQRKENEKVMEQEISDYRRQQVSRKKEMIKKIKEERKKIQTSKKFYADFNKHEGRRIKSESKVIQQKLMAASKNQLLEKQQRIKQANQVQLMGKSKISLFRESRLSNLKAERAGKVVQQLRVNRSSQLQLKELQKIQKQMILKYSESLSTLKNSRSKIKKLASIRS